MWLQHGAFGRRTARASEARRVGEASSGAGRPGFPRRRQSVFQPARPADRRVIGDSRRDFASGAFSLQSPAHRLAAYLNASRCPALPTLARTKSNRYFEPALEGEKLWRFWREAL